MSDLLVIAFPDESAAETVRSQVLAMQKEYLIELGDAVVAVKRADGSVELNQIFQPVTSGAASGALGGKLTDLGISNPFMKEVATTLDSGQAALFLLIRKMTVDKVMAGLQGVGGKVLRSSFDESKEEALQAALAGACEAVRPAAVS